LALPDPKQSADGAWSALLDEMEIDLRVARAAAAAEVTADLTALDWTPLQGLGPLPVVLVERARRIQAAQHKALFQLEGARASAAKHLAALDAVPASREHGHSVYLDVTG
jgi:hypothetical protein